MNPQDAREHVVSNLTRQLPHLKPSGQRRLADSLRSSETMAVLGDAIARSLALTTGVNSETIERLYLFGVEMRQVYETRFNRDLICDWRYPSALEPVREAFLGGFEGRTLSETVSRIKRGTPSEANKDIGKTPYAAGPAPQRDAGVPKRIAIREAS